MVEVFVVSPQDARSQADDQDEEVRHAPQDEDPRVGLVIGRPERVRDEPYVNQDGDEGTADGNQEQLGSCVRPCQNDKADHEHECHQGKHVQVVHFKSERHVGLFLVLACQVASGNPRDLTSPKVMSSNIVAL